MWKNGIFTHDGQPVRAFRIIRQNRSGLRFFMKIIQKCPHYWFLPPAESADLVFDFSAYFTVRRTGKDEQLCIFSSGYKKLVQFKRFMHNHFSCRKIMHALIRSNANRPAFNIKKLPKIVRFSPKNAVLPTINRFLISEKLPTLPLSQPWIANILNPQWRQLTWCMTFCLKNPLPPPQRNV